MQRKLSEIAEIPRILCSTLETVSQTFEKFVPENDEISDINTNDTKKLKNWDENDELNFECYFPPISDDNISLIEKESGTQDDLSNPDTEIEMNNNDDDNDEFFEADSLDGDFLKGYHNRPNESPESDYISQEDEPYSSPIGMVELQSPTSIMMVLKSSECMPELKTEEDQTEVDEDNESQIDKRKLIENPIDTDQIEKKNYLDKCWPWADRQKIIYRESTCHLVPKLSIVENRIKQLGGNCVVPFPEKSHKEG